MEESRLEELAELRPILKTLRDQLGLASYTELYNAIPDDAPIKTDIDRLLETLES